jgi:hypothetical protein
MRGSTPSSSASIAMSSRTSTGWPLATFSTEPLATDAVSAADVAATTSPT